MRLVGILVALLFSWTVAVAVRFAMPSASRTLAGVVTAAAGAMVLLPVSLLLQAGEGLRGRHQATARRTRSSWMLMPSRVLLLVSIVTFGGYLIGLQNQAAGPGDLELTLARVVGGGIVSPATTMPERAVSITKSGIPSVS